jgi:hypothetical protein
MSPFDQFFIYYIEGVCSAFLVLGLSAWGASRYFDHMTKIEADKDRI